mmetsp:Transcript_7074/g.16197  ORF Transcript_7074/g.16197 Transcript_7074/m.16197 type:complete len:204 (+) Transcript_7074:39-650(+)
MIQRYSHVEARRSDSAPKGHTSRLLRASCVRLGAHCRLGEGGLGVFAGPLDDELRAEPLVAREDEGEDEDPHDDPKGGAHADNHVVVGCVHLLWRVQGGLALNHVGLVRRVLARLPVPDEDVQYVDVVVVVVEPHDGPREPPVARLLPKLRPWLPHGARLVLARVARRHDSAARAVDRAHCPERQGQGVLDRAVDDGLCAAEL